MFMLSTPTRILLCMTILLIDRKGNCQPLTQFADSIRIAFQIPELSFAVVSADAVIFQYCAGVKRLGSDRSAAISDRFHIGSNTKAVTGFIAAEMVAAGKITMNSRFFDLFPTTKRFALKTYHALTLEGLLTFRGKVKTFSYDSDLPDSASIHGTSAEQRMQVAEYFLAHKPMKKAKGLTPSNVDYIMAGLMLEKASGRSFVELVQDFNDRHGFDFAFGQPNQADSLQLWGHDADLRPIAPFRNYRVEWLQSAGNLNIDLPGYCRFIQWVLKGLQSGDSSGMDFNNMLFGKTGFAFGWWNGNDTIARQTVAYNTGNAGAFITEVLIEKESGRALIIFTNASTVECKKGVDLLMDRLKKELLGNVRSE